MKGKRLGEKKNLFESYARIGNEICLVLLYI